MRTPFWFVFFVVNIVLAAYSEHIHMQGCVVFWMLLSFYCALRDISENPRLRAKVQSTQRTVPCAKRDDVCCHHYCNDPVPHGCCEHGN